MTTPPTFLALIGPTASGKEAVALALAPRLGAEILVLDSMKVYRGLDIGTSKVSPADRARVPHHLVDVAEPEERFSTQDWLAAADDALAGIHDRGQKPIFSGGTALYLKALLFGLFEGPAADPALRVELTALPREERHARLAAVDPATAARVHPNDTRRVVRALEIHTLTGRPPSELRREWDAAPQRRGRLVGLRRPRAVLYRRIDRRVDRMIEEGLVEEVRALLPRLGPTARQALGYKEVADWLEGRLPDLEEALTLLRRRTRVFCRRQLTWFKHFDVTWLDVDDDEPPDSVATRAEALLQP